MYTTHPWALQVQEIPEEEVALSERVHGILLAANGGEELMTTSGVSDILYKAGLGLRYAQVSGGGATQEHTRWRAINSSGTRRGERLGQFR